jgi:hypothetical protein
VIQVVISGCDCCKPIPTTERDVNEGIVGVPLGIYDSKMMAKDGWWRGLVKEHSDPFVLLVSFEIFTVPLHSIVFELLLVARPSRAETVRPLTLPANREGP